MLSVSTNRHPLNRTHLMTKAAYYIHCVIAVGLPSAFIASVPVIWTLQLLSIGGF